MMLNNFTKTIEFLNSFVLKNVDTILSSIECVQDLELNCMDYLFVLAPEIGELVRGCLPHSPVRRHWLLPPPNFPAPVRVQPQASQNCRLLPYTRIQIWYEW